MKTRLMLIPLLFVAAGLTIGCGDSSSPSASTPKKAPADAHDHAGHDHAGHDHHDHDGHDHAKPATPTTQPAR